MLFLLGGIGLNFRAQLHQKILPNMIKNTRFLLCGLIVLAAVEATSRAFAVAEYDETAESQLVQLINLARGQHGLPPLQEDARLQAAARKHTHLMAVRRTLSHKLPGESVLAKRLAVSGACSYIAGEAAAYNHTADAAQESFMQSPPHRAIILDPQYDAVGVGIIERDGMVWVTEDFAHLRTP